MKPASESRKATPMASIPALCPLPGSFLPKKRMTRKDSAGSRGTSHMRSGNRPVRVASTPSIRSAARKSAFTSLPFHEGHFFDVHASTVSVDQDHDREPYADLRGGHRDNEQSEHLSWDACLTEHRGECDQVDVRGVQHQLDAQQHQNRMLASEHSVHADAEEKGGQHEEVGHRHQSSTGPSSLREITTAPTSAARSRTDTISKGR